ncbi:MAG TPA: hypothetical protein VKA59_22945 [Vicinamibacterales bacterium]|jgi:hypothetical protein|nr:hypothetical protein [Vicinamibacterales bacterium]
MKPAVLRFVLAAGLVAASIALRAQTATPAPATDLDAFMSRVLERRDDNWKKLQQYVLEERETFQLIGPGATPLYGVRRESTWFPRDGRFIKSPLRINGVAIGEEDRRKAEEMWLKLEDDREKRRAEREKRANPEQQTASATPLTEEGVRQALEPGFISAAYFMRFKFDPGHYALAGRDQLEGRNVLKIEYYPSKLFSEGRSRPNKELRKRDTEIQSKMNKGALVTLWIDSAEHQILKYDFENVDLDFLPGRWLVHLDGMNAAMEMGQPFPSVWLPRSLRIGIDLTLATGEVAGRYAVDYYDYKLATVATKVR